MPVFDFTRRLPRLRSRSTERRRVPDQSGSSPAGLSSRTSFGNNAETSRDSETPPTILQPVNEPSKMLHLSAELPVKPSARPVRAMDSALAELAPLSVRLQEGPSIKMTDKVLDTLDDKVDTLADQANQTTTVIDRIAQVVAPLESSEIAQKIEHGIQHFIDDMSWLMKGLDELARIHPAVTVAVLAFKAAYALESIRRENDRRVIALYVEMKDMMVVMVQLKNVESQTHVGLDGRELKDRLEELAEKTAKDIEDCANCCDTFLNKKLLVKVLKGPAWAEKLSAFVKVFSDRKAEFQFALAMHTANATADIKRQTSEINEKITALQTLFTKFMSAEERKLEDEIEKKGGFEKCRQDDDCMKSLIALDISLPNEHVQTAVNEGALRSRRGDNKALFTLDELELELRESIGDALERNSKIFARKFELQVEQLNVALKRYIRTENDRVIRAVKEAIAQGPHDGIRDMGMRRIWRDMNWGFSVEASLFVKTIQEHLYDKFHADRQDATANDEWALDYLATSWSRPMIEAFDENMSGSVTVSEANTLMEMCPSSLRWSMPHWLAYWTVGWQFASTRYIARIRSILGAMERALNKSLPANRNYLNLYLAKLYLPPSLAVLLSFNMWEDSTLEGKFDDYIKLEEDRLRKNLEKIKYNIDLPGTVRLVVGSPRIERHIYPLLYLILLNHLKCMKEASHTILSVDEHTKMQTSVFNIPEALTQRYDELVELFRSNRRDFSEHVHEYACGLFTYMLPGSDIWSAEHLRGILATDGELEFEEDPILEDDSPAAHGLAAGPRTALATNDDSSQVFVSSLRSEIDVELAKEVQSIINRLRDEVRPLLLALDHVSQLHPYTTVAVKLFNVAIDLNVNRRDYDKKICLMLAEMKNMMAVFIQLRDIPSGGTRPAAEDDGPTFVDTILPIVETVIEDIKNCANACNAYSKKRTITKVLQSASWDNMFKQFVVDSTTRRREFEIALSMYIRKAVSIDNGELISIDNKMDRLGQLFEACVSPEEQYLARLVRDNGGPRIVCKNAPLLRRIYKASRAFSKRGERRAGGLIPEDDFRRIQLELKIDPETAIRDNRAPFERSFALHLHWSVENFMSAIRHEGDRVIQAIADGPHNRIVDSDIHQVWKNMRCGGSVKALHFVLALEDYFRERSIESEYNKFDRSRPDQQDEWAIDYIKIPKLQPIIEAFDDDASGFITIAEVNRFSTSRPSEWSILHWLAYWAVGYQMAMSEYAKKIDNLLAKMFALKARVRPPNRLMVEKYLISVSTSLKLLTSAFRRITLDESLFSRFEGYQKEEEDRLRRSLQDVRYHIDASDTLEAIRGPGRIEKHVFPLLYLLLSRDFQRMRLATTRVLHVEELSDAQNAIAWVMSAAYQRYQYLSELFKQQGRDPNRHFEIYGFGMFKFFHNIASEAMSAKKLHQSRLVEYDDNYAAELENDDVGTYDENSSPNYQSKDADPGDIITHHFPTPEDLFTSRESTQITENQEADASVRPILGQWSGFCMKRHLYPSQPMISLELHRSSSAPEEFQSSGFAADGTKWDLTGKAIVDSKTGKVVYTFVIAYVTRHHDQSFQGEVQEDGRTLRGSWGYGATATQRPHNFLFKRLSCDVMRFWPSPTELKANRSRALWHFAISAVLSQIRHRLRSWKSLEQRWKTGQRYAALTLQLEESSLTKEELMELSQCHRYMTPTEARLYQIFLDLRKRNIAVHVGIDCDVCQETIEGGRIVCLSCVSKTTIDLCDKPECYSQRVDPKTRDDLNAPHLPSHDVFKLRKAIHHSREFVEAHRAAHAALNAARQVFADAAEMAPADKQGRKKPVCVKCRELVTQPCWFCIECRGSDENAFICAACDSKHGGFALGTHKAAHGLVRVQAIEQATCGDRRDQLSPSRDPGAIDKIDLVQQKLEGRMSILDERMSMLDERMRRVEDLLLVISERLVGGTGSSTV